MAHPTLPAQPTGSSDGLLGGPLQSAWLPVPTQARVLLAAAKNLGSLRGRTSAPPLWQRTGFCSPSDVCRSAMDGRKRGSDFGIRTYFDMFQKMEDTFKFCVECKKLPDALPDPKSLRRCKRYGGEMV